MDHCCFRGFYVQNTLDNDVNYFKLLYSVTIWEIIWGINTAEVLRERTLKGKIADIVDSF